MRSAWTRWFVGLLALPAVLWLATQPLFPPGGFFPLRAAWVQFTGVIAMTAMAVAMLLAIRPRWLERRLDGLDKMYRLHKWMGIAALVVATIHWLWAKVPKWAVGAGWLEKPAAAPRPMPMGIEATLRGLRGGAETVGEWAFYAFVALVVVALVQRIPYHVFTRTHRWLSIIFLVLVAHTVPLLQYSAWSQPVGAWLILAMAAGIWAAAVVLLWGVGHGRRVRARIASLLPFPDARILESRLILTEGWPGHQAGQFAFVTSNPKEGAHPYTLASAWDPSTREVMFLTKALGDHTARLPQKLHVGDEVMVEGPYGCFTFDHPAPRQIWVGAGIGITPFVARMKQLAAEGGKGQHVTMFHPTGILSPGVIERLRADAAASGVELFIVADGDGPRVDASLIMQRVPGWREASFWFCGPPGFGASLERELTAQGLPRGSFHRELFQMR